MTRTLLLTGSTGAIGKYLIPFLAEKHKESSNGEELLVRLLVRSAQKAKELFGKNESTQFKIEYVEGDLNDFNKLNSKELYEGVEKIFVLASDTPLKSIIERKLTEKAIENGTLQQVVKLSALGVSIDLESNSLLRWHAESEQEILQVLNQHNIKVSDPKLQISHVFLRPNSFMQNFLQDNLQTIQAGFFHHPNVNNHSHKLAHIDVRDVAEISGTVLLEKDCSTHGNMTFNITGPQSLTNEEVASILSRLLEREVISQNITEVKFVKELTQYGVPNYTIHMLLKLHQSYRENGVHSLIFEDFEIVMGKKPRSFEQFVQDFIEIFKGGQ